MRILHTSDWHLGQHFIGKSRQSEHQKFIHWLLDLVDQQQIDAVIIAGDVFDTGTPPSYARELYNTFVLGLHQRGCLLVITAGNHDSVSTLNESKGIFEHLNTFVVAQAGVTPEQQVLVLKNRAGQPGAVLCAIPYIRPRDLLQSFAEQSAADKSQALGEAISLHYQQVYECARQKQTELGGCLPIIATGHLTAMGVKSSESVREIYIGTLEAFPASAFPPADYIALGHIHRPQIVAGSEHIRYSGSPIPLGFDELNTEKQVLMVEFGAQLEQIVPIPVPRFQPMATLRGDLQSIAVQLEKIAPETDGLPLWLSILVETDDYLSDLQQRIEQLTDGLNVEVLQLRRSRKQGQSVLSQQSSETLEELNPFDVFERRLAQEVFEGDEAQALRGRLLKHFEQVVAEVQEENGLSVVRKPAKPIEEPSAQPPQENDDPIQPQEGPDPAGGAVRVDSPVEVASSVSEPEPEPEPDSSQARQHSQQPQQPEQAPDDDLFAVDLPEGIAVTPPKSVITKTAVTSGSTRKNSKKAEDQPIDQADLFAGPEVNE